MICPACGNIRAYATRTRYRDGKAVVSCNECSSGFRGVPDLYFKEPYWDENIASAEYPGAKFITSRREKQHWMNLCGLREAGDRRHGSNNFDPISHRHAVESLRRNK